MRRHLRDRLSSRVPVGRANRRQFLGLAGAGMLGLGAAATGQRIVGDGARPVGEAEPEVEFGHHGRGVRRVIWSVDTDLPRLALTFDDGPDPRFTPRILEVLDRFGIRATFMAMGFNALRHRSLFEEVVAAGHEIGSHTWSHQCFVDLAPEETRTQIVRGAEAIEQITGVQPTLFRPPRGRMTEAGFAYVGDLGYDIVMWSVTRGELDRSDPDEVADHVATTVSAGDIVLLHDGIGRGTFNRGRPLEDELNRRRECEVRGLPRMIDGILDRGLEPVTVGGLLEAQRVV